MARDEILTSFPDINEAFKGKTSLGDACYDYVDILNDTKIYHNNLYANKLLYFNAIEDKLERLKEEIEAFQAWIDDWCKKHNCEVIFMIRRKGFIEFNKKIRLFLLDGLDLDLIRDLLGIRIILCTDKVDTLASIRLNYSFMNDSIKFFAIVQKCLCLYTEPKSGKSLNKFSDIASQIYIPETSYLEPLFQSKVKDYVLDPKEDGYQSLHAYVKTMDGFTFELQVRTYAMHLWAGLYHSIHKAERYSETNINLNPENIMLQGVSFDTEGNLIEDDIGLFNGIDLFNLQK